MPRSAIKRRLEAAMAEAENIQALARGVPGFVLAPGTWNLLEFAFRDRRAAARVENVWERQLALEEVVDVYYAAAWDLRLALVNFFREGVPEFRKQLGRLRLDADLAIRISARLSEFGTLAYGNRARHNLHLLRWQYIAVGEMMRDLAIQQEGRKAQRYSASFDLRRRLAARRIAASPN